MSENATKTKAKDVDIIKKYNDLLEQIPWSDLKELPQKLRKLEDHPIAKALGVKNLGDFDVETPIKDIVKYLGVLVKRLRSLEKQNDKVSEEIESLKKEIAELKGS